jgi:hypothetical protein
MKPIFTILLSLLSLFLSAGNPHAGSSVLSTGTWWKLAVQKSGIYKITYNDLSEMNLHPESIDPSKIRLFGNGGGMLAETNNSFRQDDLREVPIRLVTAENDKFQPGDYFLFYGESPDTWIFNYTNGIFSHAKNLYSDYTYYYITAGSEPGKRVVQVASLDSTPNYFSHRFIDHTFHDLDSMNLIKSGKMWVGEEFNTTRNSYTFTYSFPNIDSNSYLRVVSNTVAKAPAMSKFILSVNGRVFDSITLDMTDPQSQNIYAVSRKKTSNIIHPPSSGVITMEYILPTASSLAWLDYLELSCQRDLTFTGPQMEFRDPNSYGANKITQFLVKKTHPAVSIWDVTFPGDVSEILPVATDTTLKFVCATDTLRELIAFDTTMYYPVQLIGPVPNQNLHSLQPSTLLIVSHPAFLGQSERLAAFHREHDATPTIVVSSENVYNEFGCGQKDPTAIRDFMKMLYDRGRGTNEPKYLLLFGDGTYDPKDRLPENNNFIPTYQSTESLRPLGTFITEDYFGIMGDNGGADASGRIDIGVGRVPVSTIEEANEIVDKIIRYSSTSDTTLSDWKNVFTFIADDENNNLHFQQAEQLVKIVNDRFPVYNVNKIYLDAYKMVETPAGMRIPEVNDAINQAVAKGTLILNYTGHGGEDGWAGEKVLTIGDINSWNNEYKLPVFVTATCEFSRFDNPERLTGGEMVILNPAGGAIALFTTTRLALATSNFKLDTSFFTHLISLNGEPNPRLGDLIRISKNNNGNNGNVKNFVLLGDPSINIAFPSMNVKTRIINEKEITVQPDTLLGLSHVTIRGEVTDTSGVKISGFNGKIFEKVFDKPVTYRTLGNTSGSYPANFSIQNKLLYSGCSSVRDGEFRFDFLVPKETSLQLGNGKISYYAQDGTTDANGYYSNFLIGGTDPGINPQNDGPGISLFMDSTNFVSGQLTGKNPDLLAFLSDPDGINSFYLGIGHEIVAVLDHDDSHPIVLNDYYQPALDSCGTGTLKYPFSDLNIGYHYLQMKAWDLYDNSSTKEIAFMVFEKPVLTVSNVFNAPNPVRDHTLFSFAPNQHYGNLDVQIQIFTLAGQIVKTLEQQFSEASVAPILIPWDATGDNNQQLPDGLYIYRLTARGSSGLYTSVSQKLIINH